MLSLDWTSGVKYLDGTQKLTDDKQKEFKKFFKLQWKCDSSEIKKLIKLMTMINSSITVHFNKFLEFFLFIIHQLLCSIQINNATCPIKTQHIPTDIGIILIIILLKNFSLDANTMTQSSTPQASKSHLSTNF